MSYIETHWRPATAADIGRVMAGKQLVARFWDDDDERKFIRLLCGWKLEGIHRWASNPTGCWTFCEVYDPPQWFRDKPEPEEGYRLLEKFPDELLQPGDEAFNLRGDSQWMLSENLIDYKQTEAVWYRRKIEQPKPEPKHYLLQVGDTIESPTGDRITVLEQGAEQRHYALRVGDTVSAPSGRQAIVTEQGIEVR